MDVFDGLNFRPQLSDDGLLFFEQLVLALHFGFQLGKSLLHSLQR